MTPCHILTYHSQGVDEARFGLNQHTALAEDLRRIRALGRAVVPVAHVVEWLLGRRDFADLEGAVCLTFDDGSVLDFEDVDYPGYGRQRSFAGLLSDHFGEAIQRYSAPLAASFVIACPQARSAMDREILCGRDWMSDRWWAAGAASGVVSIENHSWDHGYWSRPDRSQAMARGHQSMDDFEECERQIAQAGRYIAERAGLTTPPRLFAHPNGEASDYLRHEYLPRNEARTGVVAAFSTEPAPVRPGCDRWHVPRFVCSRDWSTPDELAYLLEQ